MLEKNAQNSMDSQKNQCVHHRTSWMTSIADGHDYKTEAIVLWPYCEKYWIRKAIMLRMGEGHKKRGRPRRRWLDDAHDITGLSLFCKRQKRQPETTANGDKKPWRSPVVARNMIEQVIAVIM